MPTREEAKEIRRTRIQDAARALIVESGETNFSMRTLAERAGVSLVTPYNLFGSKSAVMSALLGQDIEQYAAELMSSEEDPLDRIFHVVSLSKAHFGQEPDYYKAVMRAVYVGNGHTSEFRSTFRGPRHALWRQLTRDAITEGYLRRETSGLALAAHLSAVFMMHILDWASGDLTLDDVENRTKYGFALALYSTVSRPYSSRVRGILDEYQHRFS